MEPAHIAPMATALLRQIYGQSAAFREGQYEAIEATLTHRRTLVVQKTGWGKSLVYFLSTKLNRLNGGGITLVVSPLLVLMENQMAAATAMSLHCAALNSQTRDHHSDILNHMIAGTVDMVFVTPETLFHNSVQQALQQVNIGLFVIDEAHCISEWGHDFRLEYGRIYQILSQLPTHIPILATTATANHRVVNDLRQQLGNDVFLSRGSLMRNSLYIQVLPLSDIASRYAWILEHIHHLPGSGIIYCLTQRDCDHLTDFLQRNHITALSYYSRSTRDEPLNQQAEQAFLHNQIKVIVATTKLGMGYDKGDVGFVIHFQRPSNIVAYYQQIGRAGRNIPMAYTFLMTGAEDADIQNYFINTAFPTKAECDAVEGYIFAHTDQGTTRSELTRDLNIRHARIEKALTFLEQDGAIVKENRKYHAGLKPFFYDRQKYNQILLTRQEEQTAMEAFVQTRTCYNRFLVNHLDDNTLENCGVCANCLGHPRFPPTAHPERFYLAQQYLSLLQFPILPHKRWVITSVTRATYIETPNQTGICLSKYGDPGYGALVRRDKYSPRQVFCDELLGKSVEVLRPIIAAHGIQAVTFVPSLRSPIVADFALRVATRFHLPCLFVLEKQQAQQQKTMENSSHQCQNAQLTFSIVPSANLPNAVLLIDDIIDSGWTMTVCGNLLTQHGANIVVPFALADSSHK